jgi:hypothetical protein
VAVAKNSLRILSADNVGQAFNQSISRLRYTPRRLAVHPEHKTLIVAESDYQAVPLADNPELQARLLVSVVGGGVGAQVCVCVLGGGGGVWGRCTAPSGPCLARPCACACACACACVCHMPHLPHHRDNTYTHPPTHPAG